MPLPNWLKNLVSTGVIASFIHTEDVDTSSEDHVVSINDGRAYGLYVGSAGNIDVEKLDGSTQLYKNVSIGMHAIACKKVIKATTTAGDIVAGAW